MCDAAAAAVRQNGRVLLRCAEAFLCSRACVEQEETRAAC